MTLSKLLRDYLETYGTKLTRSIVNDILESDSPYYYITAAIEKNCGLGSVPVFDDYESTDNFFIEFHHYIFDLVNVYVDDNNEYL
jgi:hypothetical protein